MASLIDPLSRRPVTPPRSISSKNPDALEREHAVAYSGDESLASRAVRINRALRDRHIARPGVGRWVEYIMPDLRRVYVESNLRKAILGKMPDDGITARVVIKAGGIEYTNNLSNLILMGMVEVSGDMVDVFRTADVVGLYVPDQKSGYSPDKDSVLVKRASWFLNHSDTLFGVMLTPRQLLSKMRDK